MNPSRVTEFKVGLFTLLGIAVLVLGITWGKQQSIGGNQQFVNLRFPNSGGLIDGDPVTVNGVKKGRVEHLDVDGNGVRVRVSLDAGVSIRRDATAMIMMLELMSGKKIEIQPGTADAPLDPSATIKGISAMDIPGAMAKLGDLSADLTRVLFRADTLLESMNRILSDRELVEAIRHSIITLDATAVLVKNFVARNDADMTATVKDVRAIVSDVREFFHANRSHIETLITKTDRTIDNVNVTVAHADSALVSVDNILRDIEKGNGAAHKLIYDEKFGAQLDSTVANARRLVNFIYENGVNVNLRLGTRP